VTAAQMAVDDYQAQYKPKFKIQLVMRPPTRPTSFQQGARVVRTQGVDMVTDALNSGGVAVAKVTQERTAS